VFSLGIYIANSLRISAPVYFRKRGMTHLLKHNVTWMSNVLSHAQPYIQLQEVMKTSFNHTLKHNDDVRGKSKSLHKAPSHATRSELRATHLQETSAPHPFTEFALNTQTDEQFSPHWGSNQWNLRHHQGLAMGKAPQTDLIWSFTSRSREYCSYHDCKEQRIIHCWAFQKYMKGLIQQDLLKEYILTLKAASESRQLNTPSPTQPQYLIA